MYMQEMVTPSYMYMYGVTGVFCSIEIYFKVITQTLEAIAHDMYCNRCYPVH